MTAARPITGQIPHPRRRSFAASFELVTAVPDVSISYVSGGAANTNTATLTLAFTGDFSATETLTVKVLDAAHNRDGDLTTATVSVAPTDTTPAFPAAPGGGAVAAGDTRAVLTPGFTGDFGGTRTLAVRVLDAAHRQAGDLPPARCPSPPRRGRR